MRRLPALFALVVLSASAVACGTSGRDLREPVPNAVSPTRSTPSTIAPAAPAVPGAGGSIARTQLSLTTTAWTPAGPIPATYSCNGSSPELSWSDVPAGTVELVLAVVDPDADGFVHWLVTGIAPTNATVAAGAVPAGATQLTNSRGTPAWFGPCPPSGATHTYNFILLALPQPSGIAPNTPPKDAVAALQAAARGQAILTGTFAAGGSGTSATPSTR